MLFELYLRLNPRFPLILLYLTYAFSDNNLNPNPVITPGRRVSKTLLTIKERGSKIDRNSVFNCHLSPVGRQMATENSVSNDFLSTLIDIINVFDCRLPCVVMPL